VARFYRPRCIGLGAADVRFFYAGSGQRAVAVSVSMNRLSVFSTASRG